MSTLITSRTDPSSSAPTSGKTIPMPLPDLGDHPPEKDSFYVLLPGDRFGLATQRQMITDERLKPPRQKLCRILVIPFRFSDKYHSPTMLQLDDNLNVALDQVKAEAQTEMSRRLSLEEWASYSKTIHEG